MLDKLKTLHEKVAKDKNFIGIYFQKTFQDELEEENQINYSLKDKRDILTILYEHAKHEKLPTGI